MNIIEEYKNLDKNIKDNLIDFEGLQGIYDELPNLNDEDTLCLFNLCKNAWLTDETDRPLYSFTTFFSEAIANQVFTIDDLKKCSKWDMLEAIAYDNSTMINEVLEDVTLDDVNQKFNKMIDEIDKELEM